MSKGSTIWLVTIGEPLPLEKGSRALRTRLLARELARRGHRVIWWTSRFDHFAKRHHDERADFVETEEGYTLAFLDGVAYRRNLSVARQLNHWQIAQDFRRKVHDLERPAAIVCSFPPIELSGAVARHARSIGAPLLIDVRDLWPDELRSRVPSALLPVAAPVLTTMDRAVRRAFAQAQALLGVSRHYLNWALTQAGRPATQFDREIPLGYPDHPDSAAMRARRHGTSASSVVTFLFSGSFNNSVDLPTFLRAFRRLEDPNIRAIICGDGEYGSAWRALAEGDSRIEFAGWVDAATIRAKAAAADVGLVCYNAGSHVALPNKLFEYMSFGLPILNSIPGEASELVEGADIGWNYRAEDGIELQSVLGNAAADSRLRRQKAINSGRTFEKSYSSEQVYRSYADHIATILENC
jgi:glycosyltransferase involved in cell wall biosynthesis